MKVDLCINSLRGMRKIEMKQYNLYDLKDFGSIVIDRSFPAVFRFYNFNQASNFMISKYQNSKNNWA